MIFGSHRCIGLRGVAALLALVALAGCSSGALPVERSLYRQACAAIRALPGLPAGAQPQELAQSRVFVGKSAARVDVPVSAGGTTDTYSIWFRRVARTWVPSGPAYRTEAPPPGAGSMTPAWWPPI